MENSNKPDLTFDQLTLNVPIQDYISQPTQCTHNDKQGASFDYNLQINNTWNNSLSIFYNEVGDLYCELVKNKVNLPVCEQLLADFLSKYQNILDHPTELKIPQVAIQLKQQIVNPTNKPKPKYQIHFKELTEK